MGREPECTCIQRPQVGVGFLPKLRGHLDVSRLLSRKNNYRMSTLEGSFLLQCGDSALERAQ